MIADFYIPRLSNDMNIAVQKSNLGGQIWYRSLDPVKKGVIIINEFITYFVPKSLTSNINNLLI